MNTTKTFNGCEQIFEDPSFTASIQRMSTPQSQTKFVTPDVENFHLQSFEVASVTASIQRMSFSQTNFDDSDDEDFDLDYSHSLSLEIDFTSVAGTEEPRLSNVSNLSSFGEENRSTTRSVYALGQSFEVVSIQRVSISQMPIVESDDEEFDLEIDLTSDAEAQASNVSLWNKEILSATTSKK